MSEPTRILVVEDSSTDAELAMREIRRTIATCKFEKVETREAFLAALESFHPDLIVTDYHMPHFDGMTALKLALERVPDTPVIIWTGSLNEDVAVECMKTGASNYVLKDSIKRLGPAIIRALEEKRLRLQRKRAEDALGASEERYRIISEIISDCAYCLRFEPNGRTVYEWYTPGFVNIPGFPIEEIAAMGGALAFVHPDDIAVAKDHLRILLGGRSDTREFRILTKDGRTLWMRDHARPIWDETAKQVSRLFGSMEEITERKRAEEALRISEQTARRTAEQLRMVNQIAVIITAGLDFERLTQTLYEQCQQLGDTDTFFVALYDEATAIITFPFNYKDREPRVFPSRKISDASGLAGYIIEHRMALYIPDLDEALPEYPPIVRQPGIPTRSFIGVPLIFDDHVIGVLSMQSHTPNAYTSDQIQTLELVATQVAISIQNSKLYEQAQQELIERKRAEDSLRVAEANYRGIFDNAVEGIYQSSLQGRFTTANSAMARILGYASPDEVVTSIKSIRDQFYADPESRRTALKRMEQSGTLETFESECLRKDGSRVWISENARAVSDANGTLLHYEGFVQDITNRKISELQNARRTEELAALYETSKDLFYQQGLPSLLNTIVQRATKLFQSRNGTLCLYDSASKDLVVASAVTPDIPVGTRRKLGEGAAGIVAQTREPLLVPDYSKWEHQVFPRLNTQFGAVATVPMIYAGELIGTLNVIESASSSRQFTDPDLEVLTLLAGLAAGAVHNARLLEETRLRAEQLSTLYDAGLTVNRVLDQHVQLDFLLNLATRALRAERGEFFRFKAERNEMQFEIGVGYSEAAEKAMRGLIIPVGEERGIIGWIAKTRVHLNLPDVSADSRWVSMDHEIHSALWVPIQHEETLLGVVGVMSTRVNAFTPEDERLLGLFGNQVAVAMENARLFEAERSRRSAMTALYDLAHSLMEADDFDTILSLVVNCAVETMHVTFARIALLEKDELVIRAAHPFRVLDHDLRVGDREPLADLPLCQRVMEQLEPIVITQDDSTVTPQDRDKLFLELAKSLCLVPLWSDGQMRGLLMLGEARRIEREPFDQEKISMARNLGDELTSALNRVELRDETERQLGLVQALHAIDSAITSSTDLRVSLDIILSHIVEQLHIDAADVLLFDPLMGKLEYAAGRGFISSIIEQSSLSLGEGMAGQAALERQTVHREKLVMKGKTLKRSRLILKEGFVTYYGVPLISQGKLSGVLEIFHRTQFDGDREWTRTLDALAMQTAIVIDKMTLLAHLERSKIELELAYDSTIEGWSRALDLRDKETEGHTQRVAEITVHLARQMGISESELTHVRWGSLLHDIGKMGVPDQILNKPGPLTDSDWVIMRQHPAMAFELLSSIVYLHPAADIPYCHHEKWDGTGYPRGLRGEHIPLEARIFAIVDVWDALRSVRPYREAWPETKVRAHLKECSGKHFDPKVVEAFLNLLDILFPEGDSGTYHKPRTDGYPSRVFKI